MEYLLAFLEGIITFISPCLLPLLPVYLSYFAGQDANKNKTLINAVGFVLGFSILFAALGAFAGRLGGFFNEHQLIVNIVCGTVMLLFGLNFMDIIRLPFINNPRGMHMDTVRKTGFIPSVVFGIVFSISWTPCMGTFLGAAFMLAAQSGSSFKGVCMLLSFSLGLGIPFIASALLIHRLKKVFHFIKRHYRVVNILSGLLLVVLGILVATGMINYLYSWL